MDKIQAIAINSSQLTLMQIMQQNVITASSGTIAPVQIGSGFSVASSSGSFSQMMNEAISHVDAMQHSSAAKQTAVETGFSDDLTGAMVESQKASVAFSAMVQVRNKLTSALDDVLNMAV